MSPLRQFERAVSVRNGVLEAIMLLDIAYPEATPIGMLVLRTMAHGALEDAQRLVWKATVRLVLAGIAWLVLASLVVVIVWALIILFTAAAPDAPVYYPGITA